MQFETHSLSNHTLISPFLSPSVHYFTNSNCIVSNPSFKSGFCTSFKRMSISLSHTGLRNNGIRCQVLPYGEIDDGFYMRRCVEIARKAIGHTSPNPMVGCVIVRDGKIVGEGFHPKAGQPHAEVFALRDAGDLAENATAYVSLEPCNHYGRTPPCTEALIKSKVKKVVVGMVDPNPIVASKGVDRLRKSGIDVTVGVEEELCKKLNEAYIHQMLTGKPFVTLRYSLSVNGHLLDQLGEGANESGGYYSKLLQEYDAIILSPTSTEQFSFSVSHESGANQPLQILIARSPCSSIKVPEATCKVIVFTDKETGIESKTSREGVETVVLDQIDLNTILEYCSRQGLCSVLLDLRGNLGELVEKSVEENLVRKVIVEVLPVWDGSREELSKVLKNLPDTVKLKNLTSRISNETILLEGYF